MRIPKVIRIAGQDFVVERPRSLDNGTTRARINHNQALITLTTHDGEERYAECIVAESLLHEIFHRLDRVCLNDALREDQIILLSQGLFQVLRDNNLDFRRP